MEAETTKKIKDILGQKKVFVMMKGTPDHPQCGFTMRVVKVLKEEGVTDFAHLNIFEDPFLANQIKEYTQWPTTPQVFIDGKFIGGCDITEELHKTGKLKELLAQ